MATIIKTDNQSKDAKLFLEFVKTLSFVRIVEESIENEPVFNAETEKVIVEARKGNGLSEVKDYKNLINQLIK